MDIDVEGKEKWCFTFLIIYTLPLNRYENWVNEL